MPHLQFLFIPLACCLLFMPSSYATEHKADIVLFNAEIYTANPEQDIVKTLAIKDGLFIFVGTKHEAKPFIGEDTELIDMGGDQLLPGFIDNHNHVFEGDSEVGGLCELSPTQNMLGQIPYLRECKKHIKPGEWITGYGHVFESIVDDIASPMPIDVLDDIFPDNPVVIMEQTSHSMLVNSEALALAGIDKQTQDPQGGIIMRDKQSGELNGVLFDNAGDIVMELAWNSLNNNFKLSYEGLQNGLYAASSNGITTIGDGRMYWKRGWYKVWQQAQDNNELSARVSVRPWIYPEGDKQEQLDFLREIHSDNTDNLLLFNQVKLYSDGILNFGTAKMLEPYKFTYHPDYPVGLNYIPANDLKNWLQDLDQIGYGAHIHAIGDGGIRESLNAIEHVRSKGVNQRYTMTHLEVINPKDLPRFKPLNVDADFQIGSKWALRGGHSWASAFIGKKKSHNMLPIRAMINSGANVTLSSDWTVNPLSPLAAISHSQRMGGKPLFSIYSAIDAYTINPAEALGLADITGSIEVGKSADLVALDRVITQEYPAHIPKARVLFTMLQGEIVYEAD